MFVVCRVFLVCGDNLTTLVSKDMYIAWKSHLFLKVTIRAGGLDLIRICATLLPQSNS